MEERRKHPRRRTLKSSRIIIRSHCSTIDCLIRNLSEAGARLEFGDSLAVPDRFELLFVQENVLRPAEVIWRKETEMGVQFTGGAQAYQGIHFAQTPNLAPGASPSPSDTEPDHPMIVRGRLSPEIRRRLIEKVLGRDGPEAPAKP